MPAPAAVRQPAAQPVAVQAAPFYLFQFDGLCIQFSEQQGRLIETLQALNGGFGRTSALDKYIDGSVSAQRSLVNKHWLRLTQRRYGQLIMSDRSFGYYLNPKVASRFLVTAKPAAGNSKLALIEQAPFDADLTVEFRLSCGAQAQTIRDAMDICIVSSAVQRRMALARIGELHGLPLDALEIRARIEQINKSFVEPPFAFDGDSVVAREGLEFTQLQALASARPIFEPRPADVQRSMWLVDKNGKRALLPPQDAAVLTCLLLLGINGKVSGAQLHAITRIVCVDHVVYSINQAWTGLGYRSQLVMNAWEPAEDGSANYFLNPNVARTIRLEEAPESNFPRQAEDLPQDDKSPREPLPKRPRTSQAGRNTRLDQCTFDYGDKRLVFGTKQGRLLHVLQRLQGGFADPEALARYASGPGRTASHTAGLVSAANSRWIQTMGLSKSADNALVLLDQHFGYYLNPRFAWGLVAADQPISNIAGPNPDDAPHDPNLTVKFDLACDGQVQRIHDAVDISILVCAMDHRGNWWPAGIAEQMKLPVDAGDIVRRLEAINAQFDRPLFGVSNERIALNRDRVSFEPVRAGQQQQVVPDTKAQPQPLPAPQVPQPEQVQQEMRALACAVLEQAAFDARLHAPAEIAEPAAHSHVSPQDFADNVWEVDQLDRAT